MSTSEKSLPRHHVFGMDLPVIAELSEGFKLVAHENGPAIANDHAIYALDCAAGEPPPEDSDLWEEDEGVETLSYCVRAEAIREYRKWSWAYIQGDHDELTQLRAENERLRDAIHDHGHYGCAFCRQAAEAAKGDDNDD
jgi:hypothetical protein